MERLNPMLPLPSFMSVEVSVNFYIWLCTIPPLHTTKAFELFDEDVHRCIAQFTAVDTSDHAWHQARLSLSRGGLGLHSLTQHSLAAYIASVLPVLVPSLNATLPQQFISLILLYHHQRQLTRLRSPKRTFPPSWSIISSMFFWTCSLFLTRLACYLFPPLMQHHGYLSLLQRVLVSILTLPNSRLPLSGGLAWTIPMVLAAHCTMRLP